MVPLPDFLSVQTAIHQGQAADPQQVDRLLLVVHGDGAAVCLDRPPVVGLDLVGFHDRPILLGHRGVGIVECALEPRQARLSLLGQERHVQGDELIEALEHADQQGHDFALRHLDLLQLGAERLDLPLLGSEQAVELFVVHAQALGLSEGALIGGERLLRFVRQLVDLVLRANRGLHGFGLRFEGRIQRLGGDAGRPDTYDRPDEEPCDGGRRDHAVPYLIRVVSL